MSNETKREQLQLKGSCRGPAGVYRWLTSLWFVLPTATHPGFPARLTWFSAVSVWLRVELGLVSIGILQKVPTLPPRSLLHHGAGNVISCESERETDSKRRKRLGNVGNSSNISAANQSPGEPLASPCFL